MGSASAIMHSMAKGLLQNLFIFRCVILYRVFFIHPAKIRSFLCSSVQLIFFVFIAYSDCIAVAVANLISGALVLLMREELGWGWGLSGLIFGFLPIAAQRF